VTLDASTADSDLSLRPIRDSDMPFLHALYASTRAEELAQTDWDAATVVAFIEQQFRAQHAWYQEQYAGSSFCVIERAGIPIGRLYVGRWEREIRIIDIALLPAYRNAGIGSALIRSILDEGRSSGRRVSIHVEVFNPALRLYTRLGFRPVAEEGPYVLMEWWPDP